MINLLKYKNLLIKWMIITLCIIFIDYTTINWVGWNVNMGYSIGVIFSPVIIAIATLCILYVLKFTILTLNISYKNMFVGIFLSTLTSIFFYNPISNLGKRYTEKNLISIAKKINEFENKFNRLPINLKELELKGFNKRLPYPYFLFPNAEFQYKKYDKFVYSVSLYSKIGDLGCDIDQTYNFSYWDY